MPADIAGHGGPDVAGNGDAGIAADRHRVLLARILIRRRPWRILVAPQFLWRQFRFGWILVEWFFVKWAFRVRFGQCDIE
jgi:hypothetical protein